MHFKPRCAISLWRRRPLLRCAPADGGHIPEADYPLVDLPINHAIFGTLYEVKRIPQIPNIGFFHGSGGRTSEQGEDSRTPHAYALTDPHGRIVVLTTHNTDFGDAYEREADDTPL